MLRDQLDRGVAKHREVVRVPRRACALVGVRRSPARDDEWNGARVVELRIDLGGDVAVLERREREHLRGGLEQIDRAEPLRTNVDAPVDAVTVVAVPGEERLAGREKPLRQLLVGLDPILDTEPIDAGLSALAARVALKVAHDVVAATRAVARERRRGGEQRGRDGRQEDEAHGGERFS